MLTITGTITPSSAQWLAIIRGLRNPMNSWGHSDTDPEMVAAGLLGEGDLRLMHVLKSEGQPNRKFLRMIPVYADVTAPLYWWKEYDTYKIGTVANSCSTMHTIHKREFKMEDFSCEHLIDDVEAGYLWRCSFEDLVLAGLNAARKKYLATKDKKYWWQMIQLLPSSYNQKRTILVNYEVLLQIHRWRANHRLDEWQTFCDWIRSLPYSEQLLQ